MVITSNKPDQLIETNNKKLIIWTVGFFVAYIALHIGARELILKTLSSFYWSANVLKPFFLLLFGYFLSGKTGFYKKFFIFAVLMGIIIGIYNFTIAKEVQIYDLITLLRNLFYMLAGFFIGKEGQKNKISIIRKTVYFVLLFLLISAAAFDNILLSLSYPYFIASSFIISPPSFFADSLGIIKYAYVVWFIYYALLLYFILFKRNWYYAGSAIAIHIILSFIPAFAFVKF